MTIENNQYWVVESGELGIGGRRHGPFSSRLLAEQFAASLAASGKFHGSILIEPQDRLNG